MIYWICPLIVIIIILLLRVCILNRKKRYQEPSVKINCKEEELEKLAELIRCRTISHPDYAQFPLDMFDKFNHRLRKLYPLAFSQLKDLSLGPLCQAFVWEGKNSSLLPHLFLAHSDVVTAEDEGWEHDPFSGEIQKGILWGRGSQDIKVQIAAMMEAVERLIQQGFQPERSLYFAVGGDEEVSGAQGAGRLAAWFREQGIRFELVLDEGGIIALDQLAAFTSHPVALLGVEEKGRVTYSLELKGPGGHASMPPKATVLGKLSMAAAALVRRKYPSRISTSFRKMLEGLVPYTGFMKKILLANLWLFRPLIRLIFSAGPSTNSVIRTTRTLTMFHGGTRVNVLPHSGKLSFNISILPGDTVESVERGLRKELKGSGIELIRETGLTAVDPVCIDKIRKEPFDAVALAVQRVFPESAVVPFLVNATTDSKYYKDLCQQIIRFTPLKASAKDLEGIHGVNEKLSLENYNGAVNFYYQFFGEQ